MPKSLYEMVSENGGEYSPSLDARIDLPGYRKACRKLRNVVPLKQGGATRRPGTVFIGNGKHPQAAFATPVLSRLEEFTFAPGTTFMLEFGQLGIRFFSNGAQVTVAANSAQAPTWVSGTSYAAGAFVTYSGLVYYSPQVNLDSVVAPLLAPTIWTQQSAYEVPSPYLASNFTAPNYWTADVCALQIEQINDVLYITCNTGGAAGNGYPVYKLTRYANTNWVMQEVQFLTPAMMDENATDMSLTASAVIGTGVTLTATAGAAWTTGEYYVPANTVSEGGLIYSCVNAHTSGTFATDLANGLWTLVTTFQAGHVGSYWQLAYNRAASYVQYNLSGNGTSSTLNLVGTWEVQTYGTWQADISVQASYDNGTTWQVVSTLTSVGDANYDIPGEELDGGIYQMVITNWVTQTSETPPRVVLTADNQFVYGLVQITAVASAYSATCAVVVPLYATTATIYWSEGAWSNVRGYPTTVCVFQERVWYGGTQAEPQRIWGTQTNDLENFAIVDQSQATYGLAFDLNAPGRGPIQWITAQTDLLVGLSGAEWVITSGGTGAAITATAILALEHSANGSAAALPGQIIGNAAFYVQRRGRSFMQMLYSVFTAKYMSQDMQTLSQHLTNAGIKQFAYQQQFEGQAILWAVCGDGSLISMTYAMDQEVFAWAKHTTGDGTDVGFLSVAVIPGAAGSDDEVWVSVYRSGEEANGQPYCSIERLNPVDWQTSNVGHPQLSQAVYADCATVTTSPATATISGIPQQLVGRTVTASIVPASGAGMWSIRNLVVSNGESVTIPNYVPAIGDTVVVGLPISWEIMPMRLDMDSRAGPTPGLTKSISNLYLRTLNSIGGQWATRQGDVIDIQAYPITQNSGNPPPFTPNTPTDVPINVGGLMQYELDPQFTIQGYDPLPFTLLGIAIKYDISGTP